MIPATGVRARANDVLTQLLIRNLAVIDEVAVELGAGMTVLTGETGAGKSILVDALGLALGERADIEAVRSGSPRAEISATFELGPTSAARAWLESHELDTGDDHDPSCVLRRVVGIDGRSRGYINGNAVPIQTLRELGDLLVDICGQQAHLSLTRPEQQRKLLDQHASADALLADIRQSWQEWQRLQTACDVIERSRAERESRVELLQFQVHELEALAVQHGETAELDQAQRRAANASRLLGGAGAALQSLYEGDGSDQASAHDLISQAQTTLTELGALEPALANAAHLLKDAEIQLTEAADTLRRYLQHESGNDTDLAELESRLAAIHGCARKHRVAAEELPELTVRLRTELDRLECTDSSLSELRSQLQQQHSRLVKLCTQLSEVRATAAARMAEAVSQHMHSLGMPEARFTIALDPLPHPGPTGQEKVEFRVAINPGLSPGPLTKVASGGELSRISLAIQVTASSDLQIPTLIFDEVDAGVGGGTADIVGLQLRQLAKHSQVLCVTHLPQVASKGHAHLQVHKHSDGQSTRTHLATLDHNARIEEIARMLGGIKITGRTRAHAEEMLTAAAADQ